MTAALAVYFFSKGTGFKSRTRYRIAWLFFLVAFLSLQLTSSTSRPLPPKSDRIHHEHVCRYQKLYHLCFPIKTLCAFPISLSLSGALHAPAVFFNLVSLVIDHQVTRTVYEIPRCVILPPSRLKSVIPFKLLRIEKVIFRVSLKSDTRPQKRFPSLKHGTGFALTFSQHDQSATEEKQADGPPPPSTL